MCNVNILHLLEGAKQAKGLTVIIDVFRAFSLECYLYDMDVKQIRPVGTIEEAFSLKQRVQNSVLIGERHGKKCDGFIMDERLKQVKDSWNETADSAWYQSLRIVTF